MFKRNSATKAVKLLQILLHSSLTENQGNGGISRAQLLDDLFGREELANVGNNLRVTVFRLRKMLIEAGLPEYDYIVKEKGVFYWRSPMKTDLDVVRFVELIREGEQAEEKAKKMELWEQACRLYKKSCHQHDGNGKSDCGCKTVDRTFQDSVIILYI